VGKNKGPSSNASLAEDVEKTSESERRVWAKTNRKGEFFKWTVSRSVRVIQIQKRQKGKRGRTVGNKYYGWNEKVGVGGLRYAKNGLSAYFLFW
jgi:hypothetical protein